VKDGNIQIYLVCHQNVICYNLWKKKRNNVNNTSNNRSQKINSFINEAKREQINSTALRGRDKERLFPIVQLGMTTLEHVIHSI